MYEYGNRLWLEEKPISCFLFSKSFKDNVENLFYFICTLLQHLLDFLINWLLFKINCLSQWNLMRSCNSFVSMHIDRYELEHVQHTHHLSVKNWKAARWIFLLNSVQWAHSKVLLQHHANWYRKYSINWLLAKHFDYVAKDNNLCQIYIFINESAKSRTTEG